MLLPLLILAQVVSTGGAREYAAAPEHSVSAKRYTLPAAADVPAEVASAVSAAADEDRMTVGSAISPAAAAEPAPDAPWEALGVIAVLGGTGWLLLRRRRAG